MDEEREDSVEQGTDEALSQLARLRSQAVGKPFVLLFAMVIDDSDSIREFGNDLFVRKGQNALLDKVNGAPGRVLITTHFFTDGQLHDFCQPSDAVRLNEDNYDPSHGTPLYKAADRVLDLMERTVLEYLTRGFEAAGVTGIFTDGEDNASGDVTVEHVHTRVTRMFGSGRHIVAGYGVSNRRISFNEVFANMGIPADWRRTLHGGAAGVEEAFHATSDTVFEASRSFNDFTRTSTTGFQGRGRKPRSSDTDPAA